MPRIEPFYSAWWVAGVIAHFAASVATGGGGFKSLPRRLPCSYFISHVREDEDHRIEIIMIAV